APAVPGRPGAAKTPGRASGRRWFSRLDWAGGRRGGALLGGGRLAQAVRGVSGLLQLAGLCRVGVPVFGAVPGRQPGRGHGLRAFRGITGWGPGSRRAGVVGLASFLLADVVPRQSGILLEAQIDWGA